MDGNNANKKYESIKIPNRQQSQMANTNTKSNNGTVIGIDSSLSAGVYYEIEYDSCPIPNVGKFVLKQQKIEPREKDEKREIFDEMREIVRSHRPISNHTRFFDKRVQHDNAIYFYKQGMFMKDFVDDYSGNTPFSQYFPYYHMMGYEQLRTYFTWRTEVRKGDVTDTSLSYAFVYIYELLSNIGVENPQDGLNKLLYFWKNFYVFNNSIDKYVLRWIKDYHIYYELPQSFKKFVEENSLTEHYPKITDANENFDLFCAISKYDIKKSTFFTGDNVALITDCFYFVTNTIRQTFIKFGINFDEELFQPTKKMTEWKPFKDALFYPWLKQADRRVVLSENEIYICKNNKWVTGKVIASESDRQLIGYIMKQIEVELRIAKKYKHKLSANIGNVTHTVLDKLKEENLSLEAIIKSAVALFYKEATKTVVKVDFEALSRIRQEALLTQEKLVVPDLEIKIAQPLLNTETKFEPPTPIFATEPESAPLPSKWEQLKNVLTDIEFKAISVIYNEEEIKKFADECGIMLEVLVDGINEKAMDFIGDNIMDEEFELYIDYKEQIKELIE